MIISRYTQSASRFALASLFAAALSACGGGSSDPTGTASAIATDASGDAGATGGSGLERALSVKASSTTAATNIVTTLATEGGSFTVSGTQTVQFGAGSDWIQMSVTGTGQCTNAFFGNDPDYGTVKSCQLVTAAASSTGSNTYTALATEGGAFTVSGTQTVRFGAGTAWIQMSVTGTGQCSNTFFGSDPDFGTVKSCELITPTTVAAVAVPMVTAWVRIAAKGDPITVSGTQIVRFGDGINWITQSVSSGATCSAATFGSDPSPWVFEACETQVTAPAVVQTGNAPVVNTGLIPPAAAAYTTARVQTLTSAQLASTNYQANAADIGAFRDPCSFSHMNFDDPIVYPGKAGVSHMHTFMGNDQTSASSTATSIPTSGGSTCAGGTLNRTGYWMPTLIDTRTGQPVPPIDGNMYYKTGYLGVLPSSVRPFPPGLRIIAGDSSLAVPVSSLSRFACLTSGTWQPSIPTCAVGDTLMASVAFPQCWDGVNLDSPDHKSHMAYGTGTGCPADHPVPLPEITIRFDYIVTEANSGNFWKLSSDNYSGPGGYSLHADWMYGWDAASLATLVSNCLDGSLDCHDNLLGDGHMLY